MAILGEWRQGATSLLPTTTWTAPNGLFDFLAFRNDSSTYSYAESASQITVPSSNLPDGYLLVAGVEFEDTSNGRFNPQGRFTQFSGTGDFITGSSSGFSRDNSEDRAYVRTWAFVDNPSASARYRYEWRRDTDAPTGGTVRSQLQIIPLYYANHGIYESASNSCPGGTTPNQITGWSVVAESDTAEIELASNAVTVKGDNKRYLVLGSQYWQGIGNARTQRWHGLRVDSTVDDTTKGYSYGRNAANADIGEMFTTIVETATANKSLDQFVYRGEAVGTFPNSGADVDGNTTGSNGSHAMVVLELNSGADVFKSHSTTQQDIDVAGTRVDLQIADTLDVNAGSTFTKESATEIDVASAGDYLFGANVSGGYATTSTARYTGYAEITKNGTGETYSVAGDYGRGDQSTTDCWGWSANLMGFVAGAANDNFGVNAGKITGGEGGTVDTLAGWVGFWGINLDTLEDIDSGGPVTGTLVAQETGSDVFSASGDVEVSGSLSSQETGLDTFAATGTVSDPAITGTLSAQEAGLDSFVGSGEVTVSGALSAQEVGSDTFLGVGAVEVSGSLSVSEIGSDSFTGTGDVFVSGVLSAQEIGADTFTASGTVGFTGISGSLAAQESGVDVFAGAGGVSVSGTLNAQEQGLDSFVGVGSVSVSGALAAQEAGKDTLTASGLVEVSGTLAVQEAGSDVFQGSGTAQGAEIVGTLSVQESGSDTFSGIGTVEGAVVAPKTGGGWGWVSEEHKRRIEAAKRAFDKQNIDWDRQLGEILESAFTEEVEDTSERASPPKKIKKRITRKIYQSVSTEGLQYRINQIGKLVEAYAKALADNIEYGLEQARLEQVRLEAERNENAALFLLLMEA